ncbi:cell division protein PerM [Actinomycetospora termitidis]|uniref:DUF6350 family protein n=1 Tax=Actinomycetospora termitidis TaxID=3053470 RepID=A0ABT7M4F7_9PSEU|nr:DUF6350 family protein [Actinomycetospora sp. Odt1-22]MDL5155540.1 DUF6350 family protein [Actinomycetospora sp. Odt1-22]
MSAPAREDTEETGDEPTPARPAIPPRLAVLAEVAFVPVVVSYLAVVVLAALITAAASGTSPGGTPGLAQALGTGIPLWLAVHLVPLTISGAPLGALPLAPAIGVGVLVATLARRGVARLRTPATEQHPWTSCAVPVVAAAAAVHAAAGVLAAALLTPDAATVPADASPATAGVVAGLLAAVAAGAGVAGPCGLAGLVAGVPVWVRRGVRAGLGATVALLANGTVLLLVVLLAHADAVAAVFTTIAPEAGSGAGLWLLDVAYLPNAVVAATSWLLGPGFAVGAVSAAPTGAVPGLVPPLPLAALLPSGPPPTWTGLVFALPLAVGSLVGWTLAPSSPDTATRLRSVGVAAGVTGVALAVAALLAGGRLGSGPFDPVVVPVGWALLAGIAWTGVPGAVVAALAAPAPARPVVVEEPEEDTTGERVEPDTPEVTEQG